MSSRRFPGKVLAPFRGVPSIDQVVGALRRALPDAPVLVLTSDLPSDDPLAAYLASRGQSCFRGSRDDVLARFLGGLGALPCAWVLRICADSPVLNEVLLRAVAARTGPAHDAAFDLITTIAPRSFPKGQNAEIIRADVLRAVSSEPDLTADDREEITRYVRLRPERFRIDNVSSGRPELAVESLAVDTIEDLQRLEALDEVTLTRYRTTAYWESTS